MGTNYSWKFWIAMAIAGFCLIGMNMGVGVKRFDLSFTSEIPVQEFKIKLNKCHWRSEDTMNTTQDWGVEQTAELLAKVYPKREVEIINTLTAEALLAFNNFHLKYCSYISYSDRRQKCEGIKVSARSHHKPKECLALNLAIYCDECLNGLKKWCRDHGKIVEPKNVDNLFELNMSDEITIQDLTRDLSDCRWKNENQGNAEQNWSVKQTAELLAKVYPKHEGEIINTLTAEALLNFSIFDLSYCSPSYHLERRKECAIIRVSAGNARKPKQCFELNLANYCEECLNVLNKWCSYHGKIVEPKEVVDLIQLKMSDEITIQDLNKDLSDCHWKSENQYNFLQDWTVKQTAELLAKVYPKHEGEIIPKWTAEALLNFNDLHLSYCSPREYSQRRQKCRRIGKMVQLAPKPTDCLVFNLANYCQECLNGLNKWCFDQGEPVELHGADHMIDRGITKRIKIE